MGGGPPAVRVRPVRRRYSSLVTRFAAPLAAFGLGLAGGIVVTRHAHVSPASPGWAQPVGRTGLRRSDLPVGGTLAFGMALVLRRVHRPRTALVVAAFGLGAAAGAVGTGIADPLPTRD
jgi:hypothetical protein